MVVEPDMCSHFYIDSVYSCSNGVSRWFNQIIYLSDDILHCKYIDILVELVFADPKYLMWNLKYVSQEQ